jgi:hypothetical protein
MKEINLNQEELKELVRFYTSKEKELEKRAHFLQELISTLKNALYGKDTSEMNKIPTSEKEQKVNPGKSDQRQEKANQDGKNNKTTKTNTFKPKENAKPEPAHREDNKTSNKLKTTEHKQITNMNKNGQSATENNKGIIKQAADSFERFSKHSSARYDFVKDTLSQKDTLLSDSDFALILFERYNKIIQQPAMAKSVMKELLSEMVHKKKMINKVYFPKLKTTFYGLNAWFSKEGKVKNQYLNKLNVA